MVRPSQMRWGDVVVGYDATLGQVCNRPRDETATPKAVWEKRNLSRWTGSPEGATLRTIPVRRDPRGLGAFAFESEALMFIRFRLFTG